MSACGARARVRDAQCARQRVRAVTGAIGIASRSAADGEPGHCVSVGDDAFIETHRNLDSVAFGIPHLRTIRTSGWRAATRHYRCRAAHHDSLATFVSPTYLRIAVLCSPDRLSGSELGQMASPCRFSSGVGCCWSARIVCHWLLTWWTCWVSDVTRSGDFRRVTI